MVLIEMSGEPVRGQGHSDLHRDLVSRLTAQLRPLTEVLVRTTPSSVVWFRPTSYWGFVLPWSGFTDALTPLPWPLMALTTEFLSPRHPTEDTKPPHRGHQATNPIHINGIRAELSQRDPKTKI